MPPASFDLLISERLAAVGRQATFRRSDAREALSPVAAKPAGRRLHRSEGTLNTLWR
jgi:hypothetical protein